MKKILITGATGFIGSHLVRHLLKDGVPANRLRLMVSKSSSTKHLPKGKFDIVVGNIRDKKFCKIVAEGIETIYHTAGIVTTDKGTYESYKEINVDGTINLLEACVGRTIQKFVYISSVAVYGLPPFTNNILNLDESHPKTYSDKELYGRTKSEAEEEVIKAHKKWGLPYAIIRPSTIYGPGNVGIIGTLYEALKNHRFFMIGNGKNKMHYIYITDLIKAMRQIQLSPIKNGEYIIAGEEATEFRDMVKYVARTLNQKPPTFYISKNVALIVSYILDAIGKTIGVNSPLFPDRVKVMTANYSFNISKAKREIKYNPSVSFREGVEKTIKWYLKNEYS